MAKTANPTLSPESRRHRARIASLSRDRSPDDPEIIEARSELKASRVADHIRHAVATWPPLTPSQKERLARLLTVDGGGK